jgi:hypothetical protein
MWFTKWQNDLKPIYIGVASMLQWLLLLLRRRRWLLLLLVIMGTWLATLAAWELGTVQSAGLECCAHCALLWLKHQMSARNLPNLIIMAVVFVVVDYWEKHLQILYRSKIYRTCSEALNSAHRQCAGSIEAQLTCQELNQPLLPVHKASI